MSGNQPKDAASVLAWYEAMGVDEAIGDTPTDRFSAVPAPEPSPAQGPAPKAAPRRPGLAAEAAPSVDVTSATSLAELEAMVAQFEGCGLKRTAKNTCFARGSADARIMLIGEAPGRDEDLQGKPFVGRAGKLLDKMLSAIGLDESTVYITNTIYWRPPGNRTPTPQEIESCAPFLARQIALLAPDVMVLLGGAAAKSMLQTTEGIMRLRGKWKTIANDGREIPALATLHPAYLLRNPEAKRLAWRDLLMLKAKLDGASP